MKLNDYNFIIVESYYPIDTRGMHGDVHIRPIKNQFPYLETYNVECSKRLSTDYPVGTKFRIKGKISQREKGAKFVYSHHKWKVEILK